MSYGIDQRRRQAAEQAAEWLTVLRTGKLSARERGDFVDWLRESPVHIAEMLRICRVDQALGESIDWDEIPVIRDEEKDNVVTLDDFRQAPLRAQSGRSGAWYWASAAAFAALAILGGWLMFSHDRSVIRTQVGERRELTLADGSIVDIAPATELRVSFEQRRRVVELARGQAFFHVAKDASRPFIVDAGEAQVRAVGTAFDVKRNAASVTVTVVEGRVAVDRQPPSYAQRALGAQTVHIAALLLEANEQIVVTPSAPKPAVREVNGAAEVAWTDGNLVFNDETVAEVVRRFNRHNRAQIEILDQTLSARRVSGVFKISDPESFIAFVRSTSGDASGHEVIRLDAPASQ